MVDDILAVVGLSAGYTKIPVVEAIDASFSRGTVTGLLGANGAGKSTLLKSIAGLITPYDGTIVLEQRDVTSASVSQRARAGLAFVLEGGRCFERMTVRENLDTAWLAVHGRAKGRQFDDALGLALEAFPVLAVKSDRLAAQLSGGERQMLAVARGIASAPAVLLLDEPSVGLSVRMVGELISAIGRLRGAGLTLIIAEQNLRVIEQCSEHCLVMRHGRLVWSGAPEDMSTSAAVRDAVIGGNTTNAMKGD